MSLCPGSEPQEARPGTARVLVTELSGSGHINPTPATKLCEGFETAVELYLSPEKLESLCGTRDLSHVTSLEICVNTEENTLGNFGAYLPKLAQLKMNNSKIMSVRDLGTTLSHLQVLWMSRCSLQDLDGISTFSSLKELYVAYNKVSDLGQIGMLENLQLLDLEGNDVDDLVQVQYLGLCGKLHTLTLEGNPVCVRPNPTVIQAADYSYRAAVKGLVPRLRYLDDVSVEEGGRSCSSAMAEDWAVLKNSIREPNSCHAAAEDEEMPGSARRPASSRSSVRPLSSVGSRPMSARPAVLSPPGSRPGSADSDLAAVEAETSILTHGAGKILFCGNPVQAIRARREKLRTAPTRSAFTPRNPPIHVPEHTYDLEEPDVRERADVFAELRAWREQHNKRLQALETERLPQVLAIRHSDEEEEEDDDEEGGFGGMRNDSTDEECGDTASPDSSFQSLSPDLHHIALPPGVDPPSLSPDAVPSPSPPLSATAPAGNRRPPGVRARRLQLSQSPSQRFPDFSRAERSCSSAGDTERRRVSQLDDPVPAHMPHPPPKSGPGKGPKDSRVALQRNPSPPFSAGMGLSGAPPGNERPRASRLQGRPAITRPHTARAALQKHQQHGTLLPCRGSSHPH